jgi:branched-chain amino acid transport system permease protein
MLWLQLLVNGIATGAALGMVAVSFSLVFATTRIFHVAHAGIYSLGGYLAWSLARRGAPDALALVGAMALCAAVGAIVQKQMYERLDRRGATQLVVLIASLGLLAVMQNAIAAAYTSNTLQFTSVWSRAIVSVGPIQLTGAQVAIAVAGFVVYVLVMLFAHATALGKRMRAVAANPMLAEITRLQPRRVHVLVMALASAIVAIPGVLVGLDLGLQPFGGITVLLTATIAVIAGGVGSITGAFVLALAIAVLQNLSLLVMPGEWSIAVTFFIFVVFMLFRPRGLFAAR